MSFGRKRIPKRLIIEDQYHRKSAPGMGWLLFAAALLIIGMIASMAAHTEVPNALANELYTEGDSGQLFHKNTDGSYDTFTHMHTETKTLERNNRKHVSLTQSFMNTSTIEHDAVYLLPLPEGAVVERVLVSIDNRVVLDESIVTSNLYSKTVLIEEETMDQPQNFVQRIANIEPDSEVRIFLKYLKVENQDREALVKF